jgi:hypothetical protein
MVREPDATRQPTPHDHQLMSKQRVLSLKSQLRLEWRSQDGQNETEQPDHPASLGDSITSSIGIRFSVHTSVLSEQYCSRVARRYWLASPRRMSGRWPQQRATFTLSWFLAGRRFKAQYRSLRLLLILCFAEQFAMVPSNLGVAFSTSQRPGRPS